MERNVWQRVPWLILLAALGLITLGLSGIARADEMSDGTDLFARQLLWALLAAGALVVAALFPYRHWKPWSAGLFLATLPLLVIVFWMPVRNGARCWIPLGYFDFQPSEMAKLTFILALAHYLMYRENHRTIVGLVVPFGLTLIPLGLILREPDLGSAMLFLPVLFAMLFAAGARWKHLVAIMGLGVLCLPVFWQGMNAEQKSRITSLFTQHDGGRAPRGDGYHQHQSKLVLSLGGLQGSAVQGQTVEDPAAYHLPAGRTDFVFCWVGERWGWFGGAATIGLYLLLFGRGLLVAAATREPYGRLIAVGVVALLATQTIINTGMTVGLMPIAGITLPLMSYGGSSLVATAIALGLLVNVAMRPGYEVAGEPFQFSSTAT